MPRQKSLTHYPESYHTLVREAALGDLPTNIPAESEIAAIKLRGHFYAFVGALKREQDRLKMITNRQLTPSEKDLMDTAALSHKVMASLKKNPDGSVYLEFQNREFSWQAQAVTAGLAAKARTLPTPARVLDDGYDALGNYKGIVGLTRDMMDYCAAHEMIGPDGMPKSIPTDKQVREWKEGTPETPINPFLTDR